MEGTIGWAVEALLDGKKIARAGWNGKRMYLGLMEPDKSTKMTLPYVYMYTATEDYVPWLCSQTDLLADDWIDVTDVFDDDITNSWDEWDETWVNEGGSDLPSDSEPKDDTE